MSKVASLNTARGGLDPIEDLIAEMRAGRMVVVLDDESRENEGDLIMAASKVTPEAVAFIVRHTSGIICAPMTRERLDELRLPQMVPDNTEAHRTAFTVSVDYRHGTTTGISAHDRAKTILALADPGSKPDDFSRPGHIFPLRAAEGGVLRRAGHTEASVDLARLAGLPQCAIICEIVNDDGTMKRGDELIAFAREHGMKVGTIADLIRYRFANEHSVERIAERSVDTEFGTFRLVVYEDRIDRTVHLALVRGTPDTDRPVLVRVQLRNPLQDALAVKSPEFGWPLRRAMQRVAEEGAGIVVLLRKPEDPKALVQQIMDLGTTPDEESPADEARVLRTYGVGAQILSDLGVRRMRVLSAPVKMHAISGFGLEVTEYVPCD